MKDVATKIVTTTKSVTADVTSTIPPGCEAILAMRIPVVNAFLIVAVS